MEFSNFKSQSFKAHQSANNSALNYANAILPILALLLGITVEVLVIVWLKGEISTSIQERIGPEYATTPRTV